MKTAVRATVFALALVLTTAFWARYRFVQGAKAYRQGDEARAVALMRPAAELGVARAQYFLAVTYDQGMGVVPQDPAEAAYWYRKAAGHDFPLAQSGLASMYASGRGLYQDYEQAALWYRKAAAEGVADAQNGLGDLYAKGQGVPQDDAEAAYWYLKAAEQGLADACRNLGTFYSLGRGVPFDNVRAYMWFSVAPDRSARDDVASRMTSAEIAEAERLAREWKAQKADNRARPRGEDQ